MNLQKLKKDLSINKCKNSRYFRKKLFKYDNIYNRRSFNDLFQYYRRFHITEKMLLQALYEEKFSAAICSSLKRIVFSKVWSQNKTFWGKNNLPSYGLPSYNRNIRSKNMGKYTPEYLNKLFKTIY